MKKVITITVLVIIYLFIYYYFKIGILAILGFNFLATVVYENLTTKTNK